MLRTWQVVRVRNHETKVAHYFAARVLCFLLATESWIDAVNCDE